VGVARELTGDQAMMVETFNAVDYVADAKFSQKQQIRMV